ncbi:MAG: hypothetical protein H0X63_13140, partial [Flavobacteriales bacterium]|nr:hypothetical protein [Flavobacteriales bacterium]
ALEFSKKAYKIESQDPLVIDYHAQILNSNNKTEEAINLWKQILSSTIDDIAYGDFGEGLSWAKSLVNDVNYKIGLSYFQMNDLRSAHEYLKKHLEMRKRGIYSLYSKKNVEKKLKEIEKDKEL